jgi:hypothetical protein
MNLLAERALAGDREAQAQLIPDYERAAGPEVAGALKARFAFDADIDTLVARALAGDAGAADEAVKRVLVVRGPLEADELRLRLARPDYRAPDPRDDRTINRPANPAEPTPSS